MLRPYSIPVPLISTRSLSFARIVVSFGLATLFLAPCAKAQYRASIQEVVADQSGAVVPGAKLTLVNLATNETQVCVSNDVGVYNFNALPAGHFKLTVERSGYETRVLDDVQIIPEQANALNIALELVASMVRRQASDLCARRFDC